MKVLALAVALILAACSGSVPTATNSPGTPSPVVSPSPATETVPPASTTPTPIAEEPSWPPQPERDFRYLSIEQLTLSRDGQHLSLDFVGWREYAADDPCSAEYKATATVVDGVLEVGVEESRRPTPTEGTGCDALGHARSLEVDLDEPFTGSVWRDLNGYVHFLAPPDGLVELAGLPEGWELRAQRDVEQSPTGRWERTYSPDPSLADATQSVVLYQAFDGPVNVTGGSEESQVVVNGRPATCIATHPTANSSSSGALATTASRSWPTSSSSRSTSSSRSPSRRLQRRPQMDLMASGDHWLSFRLRRELTPLAPRARSASPTHASSSTHPVRAACWSGPRTGRPGTHRRARSPSRTSTGAR